MGVGKPSVSAAAACSELALNPGQSIGGATADQYVWYDSSCHRRSASLMRNDPKGGSAIQFTYQLSDGSTRTVGESPAGGAAGFGYVVSHLQDPSIIPDGEDDSPLGSDLDAGERTVFLGTNHAVHEYTLNYPRWGVDPTTNQPKRYDVPVTIHWLFATGRDHPLWTVTFDLSRAPANAIWADTRAPYGDMNFDGAPPADWGDAVGGVAWGDRYQFSSTTTPLTLNSSWDWSALNPWAPYNLLWTQNADAEMGIAGTRVVDKQDAGGYQGGPGRGDTSANAASRCPANGDGQGAPGHVMPCAWVWAFQSVNYSFYDNNGNLDVVDPTASKRLAWGADWDYLGQDTVTTINGNTVHGWPKVSYSTFIVLGEHSKSPTVDAAGQAQVVDGTNFAASVGTVLTSGPAGVADGSAVAYSPAGYNPVYATWEATAGGGGRQAALTFDVPGARPLENPIIVLHQYTGGAIPGSVTYDGAALTRDVDYFVSYRAETRDLWLTLNRSLTGSHALAIDGTTNLASPTSTPTLSPTPSSLATQFPTPTSTPPGLPAGVLPQVYLPDVADQSDTGGGW